MKQVLYTRDIAAVLSHMDHAVLSYLNSGQIETFESFRTFDILAFDWYDIYDLSAEPSQMMIYIDRDDVFFLCENDLSLIMNFINMPELTWQGGYPTIIGVCVAVVAGLLIMFKRKKWI
ncbi:MAG: hypothetical protein GX929_03660 [Clostridiales bacterium]|jgi:hypothetical protein|nr:hypothetical protein [Clostridiales bacterium]